MNFLRLLGFRGKKKKKKKASSASSGVRIQVPKKPPLLVNVPDGNIYTPAEDTKVTGRVRIRGGDGNKVLVGRGTKVTGTIDIFGSNNTVTIGESCHFRGSMIISGNNQTVSVGDHSTTADVYILCSEGADVSIGRWCMFSRRIEIRTTDAHAVIDRQTGRRVNGAESIRIGDHVWVGVGAIINKGAIVPADSIVGALSFVNGRFSEEGIVLAGSPARIVKRGVTWARTRLPQYTRTEMDYWRPEADPQLQAKELSVPDDQES